jgi:hypothetical protein
MKAELIETELGNIYYGDGNHINTQGKCALSLMSRVKSINIKVIKNTNTIEVSCIEDRTWGTKKIPKIIYPFEESTLNTLLGWKKRLEDNF